MIRILLLAVTLIVQAQGSSGSFADEELGIGNAGFFADQEESIGENVCSGMTADLKVDAGFGSPYGEIKGVFATGVQGEVSSTGSCIFNAVHQGVRKLVEVDPNTCYQNTAGFLGAIRKYDVYKNVDRWFDWVRGTYQIANLQGCHSTAPDCQAVMIKKNKRCQHIFSVFNAPGAPKGSYANYNSVNTPEKCAAMVMKYCTDEKKFNPKLFVFRTGHKHYGCMCQRTEGLSDPECEKPLTASGHNVYKLEGSQCAWSKSEPEPVFDEHVRAYEETNVGAESSFVNNIESNIMFLGFIGISVYAGYYLGKQNKTNKSGAYSAVNEI